MMCKTVFCFVILCFYYITAQESCIDLRGRLISHGLHFVPGPDTCTLCICDNGSAKVCKAVLCSPPQDCRSFRVGNTCCEFICLDEVVKGAGGAGGGGVGSGESQARAAAGGASGAVLLAAALLLYARRRRASRALRDDRSLTSIGYISGSMGYMGGTCETALAAWKPLSNYMPRGEAPPPYDEVVAQCRQDILRASGEAGAPHRRPPPADALLHYPGQRTTTLTIPNTQNGYNAPLLQSVPEPALIAHHLHANNDPESEEAPAPPLAVVVASLHRTIPRMSGSVGEVRRSFHRPGRVGVSGGVGLAGSTGRSVPRNLDLTADLPRTSDSPPAKPEPEPAPAAPQEPAPAPPLPLTVDKPSCGCSYEAAARGADDADDYRSECANCKLTTGSKWSVVEGFEDARTQTLQRVPPPAPPPPATATLPQPVTRHSRTAMGQPSNWENWFNTIPDSDSESEEE